MRTSYEKGIIAENTAIAILESIGYVILAHRLRTPYGEIDVLAKHENTIIAVEVKVRKTLSQALECISYRQRHRICNALRFVMSERNINLEDYRIDVICLDRTGRYEHIKNAFYSGNDFQN